MSRVHRDEVPALVEALLQGNRRAAGRIISALEVGGYRAEKIMRSLYPVGGKAYVVGITGAPGAGKSTLVDELICVLRRAGTSVAILAIDPNSPFSGGAILGDRIRMNRHALDPGVFIRSMGARGHLGGLAVAAENTVVALDAMGFELILLETVGVGQSELDVANLADTTVVVIPPGQGDGIQAIKAGIMEIADVFVVNKADHPHTTKTVADIRDMLRMDTQSRDWIPPIVTTIAIQNQGLDDLWMRIQQHRQYLTSSGEYSRRRRSRLERAIVDIAEKRVREQLLKPKTETIEFQRLLDLAADRQMDPHDVAESILPGYRPGGGK